MVHNPGGDEPASWADGTTQTIPHMPGNSVGGLSWDVEICDRFKG